MLTRQRASNIAPRCWSKGLTIGFFISGASLFAAGAYLSLVNIAPQQARTKARKDFLKHRLRKLLDD